MAAYKAKFEWLQQIEGFALAKSLRNALTTVKPDPETGNKPEPKPKENFRCYLDIIEDFSYETKSNFENASDALGGLSSYISSAMNLLGTVNTITGLSGKESPFAQYMKLQTWKETEPFRMTFQFNLHTKTNPFIDVYAPAMALMSMSIISIDNKGTYHTPGVNFKNLIAVNNARRAEKEQAKENKKQPNKGTTVQAGDVSQTEAQDFIKKAGESSKLIDRFSIITSSITGISTANTSSGKSEDKDEISILTVNGCFIESCKPTWSKERTASGIPLWCNLDVTIQSISSANDSMFQIIEPLSGDNDDAAIGIGSTVATNIFR